MSSTVSSSPNSITEYLEHLKPFEEVFSKKVDAAIFFASRDIPVFPVHTVKEGSCTCRNAENCKSPGKHPIHKNWKSEVTTEKEKIKRMWLANPDANVGLAMGNGIVAIDIDVKNGKDGWTEWSKILHRNNSDQITSLIQYTPSGGLHIIMQVKDSSIITGASDALGTGIDIRSNGNILVGGGSQNDKGFYKTYDIPIAKAPYWLESLMLERANWTKAMLKRINTGGTFNQGERNKACVAYSVHLNRQGVEKDEFARKMREFANIRCVPPYEDPALEYMIEHYYKFKDTDAGKAETPSFADLGRPDFKIWEAEEERVKESITALYEYLSQGLDEPYELAKRNLPNLLMQYLKHKFHVTREIAFGKPGDSLFWYNGKFYDTEPTDWNLREKLEYLTSHHISESEKNEVIRKLMDNAYMKEQQERYLALDNGLLDGEKFIILDFTPDIFATVHLPVAYDREAKHPVLDKYLGEVVRHENTTRLQEWAGYLLIPGYPIKKGLILIGPPDSGKTTFMLTLKEILGVGNVSSATLQQLSKADQRFVTSRLYKKLVNIAPDMPSNSLSDVSLFKGITGRDLIPGEFKYKHPFDFQPRSKLLFTANSLPEVKDDDEAFFNRWDIIVFHKPPVIDTQLQKKLQTEVSGILNWMIEGAKRITDNGIEFSENNPTAETMRIWTRSANPVRAFFKECIIKEGDEEKLASDYYETYKIYAERYHVSLEDEDVFDIKFSRISKTSIIKHQKNNLTYKYRKGLKILSEEEWPDSDSTFSDKNTESKMDSEEMLKQVKKVFAGTSSVAREQSNIERWLSLEYKILAEHAHSMVDNWISSGLVILNDKCLEFSRDGDINA